MYWTDLPCDNLLKQIFSKPPKIGIIDIYDMKINISESNVIISFDLVDLLPDNPLKEWGDFFNTLRLKLICSDVMNFRILGISQRIFANIDFKINQGLYEIALTANNINISIQCLNVNVTSPSVYLNGEY